MIRRVAINLAASGVGGGGALVSEVVSVLYHYNNHSGVAC